MKANYTVNVKAVICISRYFTTTNRLHMLTTLIAAGSAGESLPRSMYSQFGPRDCKEANCANVFTQYNLLGINFLMQDPPSFGSVRVGALNFCYMYPNVRERPCGVDSVTMVHAWNTCLYVFFWWATVIYGLCRAFDSVDSGAHLRLGERHPWTRRSYVFHHQLCVCCSSFRECWCILLPCRCSICVRHLLGACTLESSTAIACAQASSLF